MQNKDSKSPARSTQAAVDAQGTNRERYPVLAPNPKTPTDLGPTEETAEPEGQFPHHISPDLGNASSGRQQPPRDATKAPRGMDDQPAQQGDRGGTS